MSYIGNQSQTAYSALVKQDITGNGGTGYTLSHPVSNENDILLYINNVKQEGGSGKAFTASGTTLTLSEAIANTDSCYVQYIGLAIQTVVPPDGSVGTAKIADSAVSTAKIADDAVNLTSKVTGLLPVANGGTGVSSGFSYSEGTWTPVVENGWGILNPTYSTNVGYYTKIGNLVHITFKIVLNGGSTNSNPLLINVIPFASNQPVSDSGVYQTLQGSFSNAAGNAENVFFKVGNINNTRVQSFRKTATGESYFTGQDAGTSFNCTFSGTYRTDL